MRPLPHPSPSQTLPNIWEPPKLNSVQPLWVFFPIFCSHFHLDHCGALPYFSEMVGYDGPIYMTHPTKAICPILLEDYRKITVDKKGETNFFTSQMIKDCMKKVVAVHLHQTVQVKGALLAKKKTQKTLILIGNTGINARFCCWQVDEELEIKAYYAGHVLGAAMFQIKVGCESVVYTVSMPTFRNYCPPLT